MRKFALSLTTGLSILGLSSLSLAGNADTTATTAAEAEASAMPATKHQQQVIEGEVDGVTKVVPSGGTVDGMPATEHQEQVLSEESGEKKVETQ